VLVPTCDYCGDSYAKPLDIAHPPYESTRIVILRVNGSIFYRACLSSRHPLTLGSSRILDIFVYKFITVS